MNYNSLYEGRAQLQINNGYKACKQIIKEFRKALLGPCNNLLAKRDMFSIYQQKNQLKINLKRGRGLT